jgi:hypothetical protein
LPRELIVVIFSYLPGTNLLELDAVCRRWKAIAEDNGLWKHMCVKEWRLNAKDFFMTHEQDWKRLYLSSKMIEFLPEVTNPEEAENTFLYSGNPLGILHALWSNSPETYFRLLSSGVQKGTPQEFLSRENTYCWTTQRKKSWYRIDLGKYVKIVPTHYTLKYGSSANYCCPRNWKFQASNDSAVESDPVSSFLK